MEVCSLRLEEVFLGLRVGEPSARKPVLTSPASAKSLCDNLIMRSHAAHRFHRNSFAWLLACCGPRAVWASEDWVVAPSGAKLKLTRADFRLDFESCLTDCGQGSSLAVIRSATDQEFVNQLLLNKSAYNVLIGSHRSPGSANLSSWAGTPSGGEPPSFYNWRADTTFLPEVFPGGSRFHPNTAEAKSLTTSALLELWVTTVSRHAAWVVWTACHSLAGFCASGPMGHGHGLHPYYPSCVSMAGVQGYAHKLPVGAWDLSFCHLKHQPMGDYADGINGDIGSTGTWLNGQLPPSSRSRLFKRHCLCQADAAPSDTYLEFLRDERTAHGVVEGYYSMVFAGKRRQALMWNLILFGVILPFLALLPAAYRRLHHKRLSHCKFWPCHRKSRRPRPESGIEAGIVPAVEAESGTRAGRSAPVNDGEIEVAVELFRSATVGAERLHGRVRFATARLGFLALLVALLPSLVATLTNQPSVLDSSFYTHGSTTFFIPLAPWALGLLLLSVRPIEREQIDQVCRAVSTVFFVGWIGAIIGAHLPGFGPSGYDYLPEKRWLPKALKVGGFYFTGFALLYAGCLLLPCIRYVCKLRKWRVAPARNNLHCLWRVVRMMYIATVVTCLNSIVLELIDLSIVLGASSEEFRERARLTLFPFVWTEWAEFNGRNPNSAHEVGNRAAWINAFSALVAFFAFSTTNRGKIIWFLGSLGRGGSRLQEAAYIKALLGESTGRVQTPTIRSAVSFAASRFRGIAVTDLGPDNFAEVASARVRRVDDPPEVVAKPALFGEVHAFVTHSWQDPAHSKLDELRKWSMEILPSGSSGASASAPLVWIDVACLEVGDHSHCKEEELQCLPFFILGCRCLLILAGDTYPSRLWCAFEIFVFLKLGKPKNEILMRQLTSHLRVGSENTLKDTLVNFDALKAKCFSGEDRQQLLSIIESSFGTADYFNQVLRKTFHALMQETATP